VGITLTMSHKDRQHTVVRKRAHYESQEISSLGDQRVTRDEHTVSPLEIICELGVVACFRG
jgi:hypothetical protein